MPKCVPLFYRNGYLDPFRTLLDTGLSLLPSLREARMDDEILIARCAQSRDCAAFEELHQKYSTSIISYFKRIAGGDVAEDLAQITWAKVWSHADTFCQTGGMGRFRPWLFKIARNSWIDHLRLEGREVRGYGGGDDDALSPLGLVESQEPTPEDYATARDISEHLTACIAALPEYYRDVCFFVYLEGLTVQQTAEILEIPIGTAQSRTNRILRQLEKCLKDKGIDL